MTPLPPSFRYAAKDITKAAAIACMPHIGAGDEKAADKAAVDAIRVALDLLPFRTQVVVGEGQRDEAPMLYVGEVAGHGSQILDLAVDPLEGTTLCAYSMPDSISVIAIAPSHSLLCIPDVYMHKIAVGPKIPKQCVSLNYSILDNIYNISNALSKPVSEINVCMLKRARHEQWIHQAHEAGAKVTLIPDGDVMAAIMPSLLDDSFDMYYGIGGAPEGVLAAAGISCLGGDIECRLVAHEKVIESASIDTDKIYSLEEMVANDVIFCATGITSGRILGGVKIEGNAIYSNHLVMHRYYKSIERIQDVTRIL